MSAISFYREPSLPFLEIKLCSDKSASYRKHFHEEYSLGFIEEGSTAAWCDGRYLDVEAGRFIWIPPYLPHACNPKETSEWRYKMLFFDPDWVHRIVGGNQAPALVPFVPERAMDARCINLMNRLVHGMKTRQTPLEIESAAIHLVNAVIPPVGAAEARRADPAKLMKPHVIRAKDYLHEHFLEGVTLERLEEVSGISKFHLIHAFKQEHNLPPHAYQNLLKINFAKRQLSKARSISDVAAEAGFYDQSHFTRLFKHFVGVTPAIYKNAL